MKKMGLLEWFTDCDLTGLTMAVHQWQVQNPVVAQYKLLCVSVGLSIYDNSRDVGSNASKTSKP